MTTRVSDLRRWTEELARDPNSLAFIPLARAYRRMGRADAALKLCLRGVQRNPSNAEARNLLARLYLDAGERDMAADAWSEVLRLDPENFEAHRGLAFYRLEHRDWVAARRHLEAAARLRPGDPLISGAIEHLDRQTGAAVGSVTEGIPRAAPTDLGPPIRADGAAVEPARAADAVPDAGVNAGTTATPRAEPIVDGLPAGTGGGSSSVAPADCVAPGAVPVTPPEPLPGVAGGDPRVLGALVLDARGLVVEGSLAPAVGADRDTLAASLGATVEEATRVARHLNLGGWRGLGLETPTVIAHLSPLGGGYTLLLVVRADTPPGWVARLAERAAAHTRRSVGAL